MRAAQLSRAQTESIVEAGILAPSADNRHMLRFDVDERAIRLRGSDDFGRAPFHRRVLALISVGAVVENMVLRAARYGFLTDVAWCGGATIAELRFGVGEARASDLEAAIPQRHTNRRLLYRGPGLTEDQGRQIAADVQGIASVRLLWLDLPDLRRRALRLISLAEAERFRSRPLHEDLFSAIRFDVGWRATATEGLPPGALEIELPMRPIFKALRHWTLMRALTAVGSHRLIGLRAAYAPCRVAPHLGALATNVELERGAIEVGRALERVWLRATSLGLAFQPFAASTLLALSGYQEVDERVRGRLAGGWKEICAEVTPLMLFRMGHARAASIRSGRPDMSDFTRALGA